MKKECKNCFYHIHIEGRKPFCYKHFSNDPEPCDEFRGHSCQICQHGKGFDKCQLKNKAFPKTNKCKDFARYEGWAHDENG